MNAHNELEKLIFYQQSTNIIAAYRLPQESGIENEKLEVMHGAFTYRDEQKLSQESVTHQFFFPFFLDNVADKVERRIMDTCKCKLLHTKQVQIALRQIFSWCFCYLIFLAFV